ncbi:MAG: YaiI/YqxD family protein [Halothermotrichaceae bacterium]
MRILVDADACPVLKQIEEVGKKYQVKVIAFSDVYHNIKLDYGEIRTIDKGAEAVDMAIVNTCQKGDIVVTQDYGLASLVMGKQVSAVNNKGKIYNEKNIDYLLMRRHIHKKIRRGGGRHKNPKKRKKADDQKFKKVLIKLVKEG